ncbi:MAG: peptidase M3, partial [Calditrichia bacterium]|nr:peptidase M3 [Calditrichia bacterium]
MKNIIFILIAVGLLVVACSKQEENPFFSEWDTPFGVPPFSEIKEQHYLPAFKEAIKQHQQEIDAIVNNSEAPTFTNTIEALDKSGALLTKVENVFYALNSSNTNSEMQKIAKEVSPLRSKHYDGISMNAKLFERIKAVYNEKNEKGEAYLTLEQTTLLEENYKDFVRSGANLNEEDKGKLKKINEELSALSLKFGENILEENNRFELVIEKKEELAGLPDAVITGAAETAKARGHEGKWAFTLHKPSLIPFLQYSENREYREKMFKGYINRGDHNDSLDTKEILVKMVELRLKKAKLLGYKSHAHFILDRNMAQTPEKVYNLLDKLWEPALKRAKVEVYDMQDMINKEGKKFKLEPWDWWYYAE